MSETTTPIQRMGLWLAANAGYPARRLPEKAESMLWIAAFAEAEESQGTSGNKLRPPDSFNRSAFKAHAMNRSHAHFKSDNSAKV